MRVILNGEAVDLEEGTTVAGLVADHVPEVRGIAVAVNAEVAPRSTWTDHVLADGDRIELLAAAQGG